MRCTSPYPSLRLIVMPQEEVRNNFGRKLGTTPALRVEFSNKGVWDSDAPGVKQMFAEYARRTATPEEPMTPDDVAAEVEEYLKSHPERGYRFHIEDQPINPATGQGTKVQAVCIATKHDGIGGESTLCGKPAMEGSDYCAECAEEL